MLLATPAPFAPPGRGPAAAIRATALEMVTDLHRAAHRLEQLGLGSQAPKLRQVARLVAAEYTALSLDDGPLEQTMPVMSPAGQSAPAARLLAAE